MVHRMRSRGAQKTHDVRRHGHELSGASSEAEGGNDGGCEESESVKRVSPVYRTSAEHSSNGREQKETYMQK